MPESRRDRHLKKRCWKRRPSSVSSAGRLVPVELDVRKSPTRQEPSCGLVVNKTGLTDELPRDAKAKQALVGREVVGSRGCVSVYDQLAANIDHCEEARYRNEYI